MDEAYSFVQHNLVTLYEKAVTKQIHQLPAAIEKKQQDPTKKLNEADRLVIRGYQEMKEDLTVDAASRRRGVIDFQEDFEFNENENDDDDLMDDDEADLVDDDNDLVDVDNKLKQKEKKTKQDDTAEEPKKKKKKRHHDVKAEGEKTIPKKKKGSHNDKTNELKQKKSKKLKKDSTATQENTKGKQDDEFDFNGDDDDSSAVKKSQPAMDAVDELKHAVAADNLPDSEDEMDDNYDPPSEMEEEPDQEEVEEIMKVGKKTKNSIADTKINKKDKKKKNQETRLLSEDELKKRELKAFRHCEERFCPLLERWHKLLASSDDNNLQRLLSKLVPLVNDFSVIFIEAYDISKLLKETKNVLKLKNATLERCAELKEAFRESYSSKRDQLPKGLKIRKSIESAKEMFSSSKGLERPKTEEPPASSSAKEVASSIGKTLVRKDSNSASAPVARKEDPRTTSPKPPVTKKKFSLTNLMRQGSGKVEAEVAKERNSLGGVKKLLILPAWMTEGIQEPSIPLEGPRALALEFLLDMAAYFPSSKVNKEGIARAVEAAIYKEASKQSSEWIPLYWRKVHNLVAAICGKIQPTNLFDLIMSGRFETADQLVGLPEKTLMDVFEGGMVIV